MRNKLIAIAAVLVGPFLIYSGLQEKSVRQAIEKDGVTVPARIEGGETRSRKGVKSFKLDVSYPTPDGQRLEKTFTAPREYVERHVDLENTRITDERAEVRYLQSDPHKSLLVGAADDPMTGIYIGIAIALGGLGWAFYLFRKKPAAVATPAVVAT